MPDRLLVDLGRDGTVTVSSWPDGMPTKEVSRAPYIWPLGKEELEDLRWYLEEYLLAPYGVWEDRGPGIHGKLATWGEQVYNSVFANGQARSAYERARDRGLEVVVRSAEPTLLGLPWELMRDPGGPVAMGAGGISRSFLAVDRPGTLEVLGGKLRVLMVISRPGGTSDVAYQMVARPLLERLDAVRGEVELTVLRPATFVRLREVVRGAADAGEPFHVVHFDGHGAIPDGSTTGPAESVLAFEMPGGGSNPVGASAIAKALAGGNVPVVVLNACQSGAVGKELEASVATALLKAGCAAVVAMAYSVYAVAAAEFMAAFYESLFAGGSVGQAVTAGRRRLFEHDARPSPKGDMPLADWLVPVHYHRREVRFPQARTVRQPTAPSLDEALNQIDAGPSAAVAEQDPLASVAGVFVGRDDLFYRLETAARQHHVVALTGPGGTGKTELAKGFARWLRDTGGVDDPRLVFWHSFEPGVASFGLDEVITALGLEVFGTDFVRLEPSQRLAEVQRFLAQYRALLVWDNFESVKEMPDPTGGTPPLDAAGCATLKSFLDWVSAQSPSVVLITSRAQESWLGPIRRIGVGGLNRAEAAQYAGRLLEPFPASGEARGVRSFGELLDWLDGHPLAMRLTLPRLESTSPDVLLAALRGTSPIHASGVPDTDRTTSLAASITYSYAHLSDETRRLLPVVSLFHDNVTEAILAAFSFKDADEEDLAMRFTGVSRAQWSAMLADAVRVGLLTRRGTGIYRIHPTLPNYLAAAWYAESPVAYEEERQACERVFFIACASFCSVARKQIASGDAAFAYALIGLQRRTLGATLDRALDLGAWGYAENIVRALDDYWEARGLSVEAASWSDRILDAVGALGRAPSEDASALWVYATNEQANRQMATGRLDQAHAIYNRVLAYLCDLPETEWTRSHISATYHQLGMVAQMRGRLEEAETLYRKALAIEEELDDRSGMASNYQQLGANARDHGRPDEADDWFRKALAIKKELDNRPGIAVTYNELGITAFDRGRLDEAEDWCRKSLAIVADLGDRRKMAAAYHQLGVIAWKRDRPGDAEKWYRESLAVSESLADRLAMANTYHQLGTLARDHGRLDEANEWYRESLAMNEALDNRPAMANTCLQLGTLARDRGRLDEADAWCRRSLAVEESLGNRAHVALKAGMLCAIAHDRGRLDEAEDWCRKSLAISDELGNSQGVAMMRGTLALILEARQQPRQALEWHIRCVASSGEFPSQATDPPLSHIARLSRQLGLSALEESWRQVVGQPVPRAVHDYVTSHQDEQPAGEP
jgi:tetratricopeptide (TPR) repeat protein